MRISEKCNYAHTPASARTHKHNMLPKKAKDELLTLQTVKTTAKHFSF